MNKPIKTLFLGTDWESVATLEALHKDIRFNITGVITTVDKPVGRKQILMPSKVKEYALKNSIEVFHTEKKEEKYKEALERFKPDIIVCKAFGEIVPSFFLEYPKYKSINVHFSLLPKYRGATPIQKAILNGDTQTGISIMLMSEKLDEGDILQTFVEKIFRDDTNLSLRKRLVKKSSEVLGDVLQKWINKEILPIKQDSSKATYCWQKDISKENAEIQWQSMEPEYIERMIRAMIPWPIAWFTVNADTLKSISGKKIKIFKSEIINLDSSHTPGNIYIKEEMLLISSKNPHKSIRLLLFQIEGKKETTEKEFINGLGRELRKQSI